MWELPQKLFLKMAADRGRYIDQSQSTNIYLKDPRNDQLQALHLYTDRLGLKTGMYYLRELPTIEPIKFTVDPKIVKYVKDIGMIKVEDEEKKEQKGEEEKEVCIRKKINGEVCLSCS